MSIFLALIKNCVEVLMDDFIILKSTFDECLQNLEKVLARGVKMNLELNYEKCHFTVTQGVVLGRIVSEKKDDEDK